ncbi:MAG: hypothetical protein VYA69_03720 [Gemmatimonadota bacterium]|mgnify:CR=1 FL=1|nr:hypothetical protein [Gemmatimonadota bacterium]
MLSDNAGGIILYHTNLAQVFHPKIKGLDPNKYGHRLWGRHPPDYERLCVGREQNRRSNKPL